jgi:hypothetical protein
LTAAGYMLEPESWRWTQAKPRLRQADYDLRLGC